MRVFVVTVLLMLANCYTYCQTETAIAVAADTIILVSGKKVPGKIVSLTTSKMTFKKQNSEKLEEIPRKQLHKAIYATGRVEKFNSLAFQSVNSTDYKSVIITENLSDVDGLFALGNIQAKSGKNSRNAKNAERSATIKLQKKAAALGGVYVLLTKNEAVGGYREVPTHYFEGVAYGFDPPAEGPKK